MAVSVRGGETTRNSQHGYPQDDARPTRHSPYIEERVVHDKGAFDLEAEVDLFAAQLTAQLRAATSTR